MLTSRRNSQTDGPNSGQMSARRREAERWDEKHERSFEQRQMLGQVARADALMGNGHKEMVGGVKASTVIGRAYAQPHAREGKDTKDGREAKRQRQYLREGAAQADALE